MNGLSGFKKVRSTPSMTVLRHPSGHEISIAHSGLGGDLKRQLSAMPVHLADGTPPDPVPVADEPNSTPAPSPDDDIETEVVSGKPSAPPAAAPQGQPDKASMIALLANHLGKNFQLPARLAAEAAGKVYDTVAPHLGEAVQGFSAGLADKEAPTEKQVAENAAPDTGANPAAPASLRYNIPQGETQGAQPVAYKSPYEEEASAAKQYASASNDLNNFYQGHLSTLDKMSQDAVKHFTDKPIDAKQYMTTMDAPQKVTTALGLILGGISGGLNGTGKNPAMDYLNQQIDRNIQAQAMNLGQKSTLLSALHQQFGNMKDAVDMAKAINTDTYQAQMAQATAKIQDPMQRQRMIMAMNQLQQQSSTLKSGVAQRQAAQSGAKQGGMPPQLLVDYMPMDPKEKEQATKEITQAQETEKMRSDVIGSFQDLQGKVLAGALSPSDRSSAMNAFAGRLAKLSEGRFNFQEAAQQMDALLPAPLDSAQTKQHKLTRLNQLFDAMKTTPILDAYGIKVDQAPMVSPNQNITKSYGQAR